MVAIMGILFSLAYPGFTAHYDMINLSGSADKMHSHTNWAKNTAIVREKNAIFRIWAAGDEFPNEYQFAVIDEGDGGLGVSVVPPGEPSSLASRKTAIGNNVQIVLRNCEASNPCVLTYSFSSGVWNDPDVEIDLSLADQTARIIEIDEITGLFTLE